MEKEFLVSFQSENVHISFTTQIWRQEKTKREGLSCGIRGGVEIQEKQGSGRTSR